MDAKTCVKGAYVYKGVVFSATSFPKDKVERSLRTQFDHEDIIVTTYPKSGTTWSMEITWLLLNKCDFNKAKLTLLNDRCPALGYDYSRADAKATALPPPRVFKSHMPEVLMRESLEKYKPRVIVVMRNPKDALVSRYHFYSSDKLMGPFKGTWDDYFEMYINGELPFGLWEDHVRGYWAKRGEPNYHFIKYEDMKRKPKEVISGIADFLDVSVTESELDDIVEHTSFKKMKENKMVNRSEETHRFQDSACFRKGIVGDWKNYFSSEQNNYFDKIMKEFESQGLKFDME